MFGRVFSAFALKKVVLFSVFGKGVSGSQRKKRLLLHADVKWL
jgi:hypothetical protein